MTDDKEIMTVTASAELGSSLIDLRIENADAAQLFALSEMLRVNAQVAFAGQMAAQQQAHRPTIVPVHGRVD